MIFQYNFHQNCLFSCAKYTISFLFLSKLENVPESADPGTLYDNIAFYTQDFTNTMLRRQGFASSWVNAMAQEKESSKK